MHNQAQRAPEGASGASETAEGGGGPLQPRRLPTIARTDSERGSTLPGKVDRPSVSPREEMETRPARFAGLYTTALSWVVVVMVLSARAIEVDVRGEWSSCLER